MDTDLPPGLATLLAQANLFIDPATGAVTPPIVPATTYARDAHYELRAGGLSYSRDQNPSYAQVEALLSRLEGGAAAMLFSSGMAAATALFQTLESEHHVVAPLIMYHGLRDWLNHFCHTRGVALDYFDAAQPGSLERAVRPGHTKLVWIETPANPTWDITDIAAAARLAHQAGARLGVDSTVATPVLTRPLENGADFVFHSATKFLNGHSDVVAGALISRVQDEWWDAIRFQRHAGGGVLGSFETWLLLRGMRTLHLRVREACTSAARIAHHFHDHKKIDRVLYPGLAHHPGHAVATRQMHGGYGAMLSLLIKGGAREARAFAARTRVFVPATSLGGVESLVEHRASVEGPNSPVPPNLVRLSVGIEDVDDLIADLERTLAVI